MVIKIPGQNIVKNASMCSGYRRQDGFLADDGYGGGGHYDEPGGLHVL